MLKVKFATCDSNVFEIHIFFIFPRLIPRIFWILFLHILYLVKFMFYTEVSYFLISLCCLFISLQILT